MLLAACSIPEVGRKVYLTSALHHTCVEDAKDCRALQGYEGDCHAHYKQIALYYAKIVSVLLHSCGAWVPFQITYSYVQICGFHS